MLGNIESQKKTQAGADSSLHLVLIAIKSVWIVQWFASDAVLLKE